MTPVYRLTPLVIYLFCVPLLAQSNQQYYINENSNDDVILAINNLDHHDIENAPGVNHKQLKKESNTDPASDNGKYLRINQIIVEYKIVNSTIHISITDRYNIRIKSIPLPKDINLQIRSLRKSLTDYPKAINLPLISFNQFTESTSKLYEYLIKPIHKEITGKDLVFVLDEPFRGIPFEVLLENNNNLEKGTINYKDLTYLFKSHKIAYAYNPSISKNHKNGNNSCFLGFAPVCNNNSIKNINAKGERLLTALKYSSKEVNNIKKYCPSGKTLKGKEATEKAFYDLSKNFNVLHFSTHAVVDNQNPQNSYLVLSTSSDEDNDGKLYVNEIAKMNLSAKMAVLAACNTGNGNINGKQGLISIGSSFLKAGCSSVVMSLWSAYDESTSLIMEYFYHFLANGSSKDEALQQAKLKYIENADALTIHPLYWANFVVIGDTEPIDCFNTFGNKNPIKWVFIIPLIAFGLGIGFKIKGNKSALT